MTCTDFVLDERLVRPDRDKREPLTKGLVQVPYDHQVYYNDYS